MRSRQSNIYIGLLFVGVVFIFSATFCGCESDPSVTTIIRINPDGTTEQWQTCKYVAWNGDGSIKFVPMKLSHEIRITGNLTVFSTKVIVETKKEWGDNIKQQLSCRIWNKDKSSVLVYLLNRSTTWTLPTIQEDNIIDGVSSLLKQFPESELISATCIVNISENVPILLSGNIDFEDIVYQYIIYDVRIEFKDIKKIILPDNIRASYYMSPSAIYKLVYKTPILNHLIKYMKEEEKSCHL